MLSMRYVLDFNEIDKAILVAADDDGLMHFNNLVRSGNFLNFVSVDGSDVFISETPNPVNGENVTVIELSQLAKNEIHSKIDYILNVDFPCHNYIELDDYTIVLSKNEYI